MLLLECLKTWKDHEVEHFFFLLMLGEKVVVVVVHTMQKVFKINS